MYKMRPSPWHTEKYILTKFSIPRKSTMNSLSSNCHVFKGIIWDWLALRKQLILFTIAAADGSATEDPANWTGSTTLPHTELSEYRVNKRHPYFNSLIFNIIISLAIPRSRNCENGGPAAPLSMKNSSFIMEGRVMNVKCHFVIFWNSKDGQSRESHTGNTSSAVPN